MNEFKKYKDLVERELRQIFTNRLRKITPKALYSAMTYSVLGPGKRLRPILCLMAYEATCNKMNRPVKYSEILPFACGLEFIHTFSLIQDDLPAMDNDDFRRGRPSVHRKYGEALALLAADALFAYAFELFSKAPLGAGIKTHAISVLSEVCGAQGLVGGQTLDILNNQKPKKLSYAALEYINKKKTASLIGGAMKIGAIVAGAPIKIITILEKAGIALGLLFQLTDDLIDKRVLPNEKINQILDTYFKEANSSFDKLGEDFKKFKELTKAIKIRTA
ncbi:MAG: polyprenyl synthetase family protein [candidate division WOR-3 bacterium]|nr:polyprenyl synthetase family protein [candidate division WOR-3 bacterium]MCX7757913.1 polyprenyl synthetase family protein [candidate division WOR-3 bacterium]MDW7987869.1 polyprenyl synthetase family protein [candidate division WOR-3 bacterium]